MAFYMYINKIIIYNLVTMQSKPTSLPPTSTLTSTQQSDSPERRHINCLSLYSTCPPDESGVFMRTTVGNGIHKNLETV